MIGVGPGIGVSRPRGLYRAIQALFAAGEKGVWYDPSDLASMFQDSAGTTAAVVGQPVGKILDKSGNGYHATQSTSTARPILRQSGSLYYLEFDGVDDFLVTPSIDFRANGKLSCHVGVTANNNAGPPGIVGLGLNYSELSGNWVVQPNFRAILRYGAGLNAIPEDAITVTYPTTRVVSLIGEHGVADWTLRVDGVAGTPVASTVQNMSNKPIYLGVSGVAAYLNGGIYSVVVRGALSDASQIAAAESYVNSKTGAYG